METFLEYFSIINNRLKNPLPEGVYGEKHHIYPKSCGGSNDRCNIIKLTPEEHFRCHSLLPDIFKFDPICHRKMLCAWNILKNDLVERGIDTNSEEYGKLKREFSKSMSLARKGKKLSEETKQKMSLAHKNNPHRHINRPGRKKGFHMSEEHKQKISLAAKQRISDRSYSIIKRVLEKRRARLTK